MGDSETVASETSSEMGYTSARYSATGYADARSNSVPDAGAFPSEPTGDFAAPAVADAKSTVPGGSDLGEGSIYGTEHNSVLQEAHVSSEIESKPAVGVSNTSDKVTYMENVATELPQAAGDISYVNGGVNEVGNQALENGSASDNVGRGADEQQFDGFGNFFESAILIMSIFYVRVVEIFLWVF